MFPWVTRTTHSDLGSDKRSVAWALTATLGDPGDPELRGWAVMTPWPPNVLVRVFSPLSMKLSKLCIIIRRNALVSTVLQYLQYFQDLATGAAG